jgi:N-acylneuraminate cytidylyltransferase
MKDIAIIPMREGSKGIPHKNRKKILGRPLFTYTLSESIFSNLSKVYVFTDDDVIKDYINKEYNWTDKIECIERGAENANDKASTESAIIELLGKIDGNYETISLIQATSPLLTRVYINKSIDKIKKESYDTTVSVVESKKFFWNEKGESINYDYKNRPRRQDFEGIFVENGAIYTTTRQQFIKSKNRLGGKVGLVIMPENTMTEIDEPNDWDIVEKLIINQLGLSKSKPDIIKAVVLDVDGVFTNGEVINSIDGEFSKSFSIRDGMGIELLRESGVKVIVMTSEDSSIVATRMSKLKIDETYLGVKDKYSRLEQVLIENNFDRKNVAYMGDDINDLANLCSVGWSFCPGDAEDEIKQVADFTISKNGGKMAVRELIKIIIKINNRF